jgi:hypothetical protein
MRVTGLALIVFSAYVGIVYGAAAKRILRHAGVHHSRWDPRADYLHRFCLLAVQEQRPWRGRVLRDTRRVLLAGMAAGYAGLALLGVSALIEIL